MEPRTRKPFIKRNLAVETFPALVPPKITLASLVKLDKGWGTGLCLERTEEAERGRRKSLLGNRSLLIETICSLV